MPPIFLFCGPLKNLSLSKASPPDGLKISGFGILIISAKSPHLIMGVKSIIRLVLLTPTGSCIY